MNDRLGQLERLKALHDGGALTREEFEAQKAAILAGEAPARRRWWPWAAGAALVALVAVVAALWQPARMPDDAAPTTNEQAAPVADASPPAEPSPASAPTVQPTAAAAVSRYAGAVKTGCKQGGCFWEKRLGTETVRTTDSGVLKLERTYQGETDERERTYPDRYDPSIPVTWEPAVVETYVFCSKTAPGTAFLNRFSDGAPTWIGHLLDLYDVAGYNTPSAQTYMRVCHGEDFFRADIAAVLRRLGYRPGTRSEQVDLAAPTDLAAPPPAAAE